MLSQKMLDEIAGKVNEVIGSSPAKDLERNMRAMLSTVFSRLDLVTREEFDVQAQVLLRTREKLGHLEARLADLERRVAESEGAAQTGTAQGEIGPGVPT